ncbi:MAG: o-succinylbenzoate synthase [Chlorobiales bacterium]|nr:o-succinylbenzoate synthase [Chlorobiales bacterium]
MKIAGFDIYRYEIPFVHPIKVGGRELHARTGLVVCFYDEAGHTGHGEIAPLPGLHHESLEEATRQFRIVVPDLQLANLDEGFAKLSGRFDAWLSDFGLYPSVRLGIEMAVLNLLSDVVGKPLYKLLACDAVDAISVNGLLSGTREEILKSAACMKAEGYRTVKLKVGRLNFYEEIEIVKIVRNLLGKDVILRLDANRSWSFEQAVEFGLAVADCNIEYIEEPLQSPSLLCLFTEKTGIPIALDETLADGCNPYEQVSPECLAALVLKPSVLGGLERTAKYAREASRYGVMPVISSTFDSGLSLAAFANLAATFRQRDVASGLDTYKFLQADVLEQRFEARGGFVYVGRAYQSTQNLNFSVLEKLSV